MLSTDMVFQIINIGKETLKKLKPMSRTCVSLQSIVDLEIAVKNLNHSLTNIHLDKPSKHSSHENKS